MTRRRSRQGRSAHALLALVGLLACCWAAGATENAGTGAAQGAAAVQPVSRPAAEPAADPLAEATGPLGDPEALAARIDAVVASLQRSERIPGAVVAIVDADGTLLLRGYGHADLPQRRPVNPDTTLFRLASITKTFTWTAVMQGIDAGRLALDTDVNTWLEAFEIPVTEGRPITIADLLTHSAGFEEDAIGMVARPDLPPRPLVEVLAARQPRIVYPPGSVPAYSNYGSALAGHLVARTRGATWEAVIEEDLLRPLAMTNTVVQQPLPEADRRDYAPGHLQQQGTAMPQPFLIIEQAPAGGMASTGADMARWLRMHLNFGTLDGIRVLDAGTAQRMQQPLRTFRSGTLPLLYGFYRMDRRGELVVGHEGGLNDAAGIMALLPDRGIGVFAAFNAPGSQAPRAVLDTVIDMLTDAGTPAALAPPADFAARADRYTGAYAPTRRNHSSLEKAATLLSHYTVHENAGHLVTHLDREGAQRWVEEAPDVFRHVSSDQRLLFEELADGSMRMWRSHDTLKVADRLAGWRAPPLHRTALTIDYAIFLLGLLGWPLAALRSGERMVFGQVQRLPSGALMLGWSLAALGLAAAVLTALGTGTSTGEGANDSAGYLFGVPPLVRAATWLHLVFALLTVPGILLATRLLLGHQGTLGQRLRLWLLCAAACLHSLLLIYWNLMPWNLPAA